MSFVGYSERPAKLPDDTVPLIVSPDPSSSGRMPKPSPLPGVLPPHGDAETTVQEPRARRGLGYKQ
jgi:hypothetical protein